MGSFNCTGFHSRLPITGGDEIVLILGLHLTPQHLAKYAFDPMVFAPDITFTPIALPVYCEYDDCRHIREVVRDRNVETIERFFGMPIEDIICCCDDGDEISRKLNSIANEKLGLPAEEYLLTYTFDHRFVYEEITAMRLPWDWETSYALTLKHSDISAGPDNNKYSDKEKQLLQIAETLPEGEDKDQMMQILTNREFFHIELDNIFREHNRKIGWGRSVANLNPKHIGTSLYRDNEAFSGEILLSIYRHHADVLFHPELKTPLLKFMNFYQALRYHNWPLTLPVYAGQEERYAEIAPLYRKMAEWVERKAEEEKNSYRLK